MYYKILILASFLMGSILLSENSKNMLWKTIPLIPRYGFPHFFCRLLEFYY